jgi:hypothetical protein
MSSTTVIPIFGYTPSARQQQIISNIIRIEATPLTWNLFKYLIVVKKTDKAAVQKTIKKIFGLIESKLENQPSNFPKPRCGRKETSPVEEPSHAYDPSRTAYMSSLATFALAQNPQDAGPAEPPKRQRKITISYAGAVKVGILKSPNTNNSSSTSNNMDMETQTTTTTQDISQTSTQ